MFKYLQMLECDIYDRIRQKIDKQMYKITIFWQIFYKHLFLFYKKISTIGVIWFRNTIWVRIRWLVLDL